MSFQASHVFPNGHPRNFYFFSNVTNVIKNVYKPTKNCEKCGSVFTVMNSQHCENKYRRYASLL